MKDVTELTDRELLELAARAAGIDHIEKAGIDGYLWNPLTNDADAFRLGVQLRMDLMLYSATKGAFVHGHQNAVLSTGDPFAATRRAITMAAARVQLEKEKVE